MEFKFLDKVIYRGKEYRYLRAHKFVKDWCVICSLDGDVLTVIFADIIRL